MWIFFDRLHFDFEIEGRIETYHKDDIKELIGNGRLSPSSVVFDHLVKSKREFDLNWKKSFSESWHSRLV